MAGEPTLLQCDSNQSHLEIKGFTYGAQMLYMYFYWKENSYKASWFQIINQKTIDGDMPADKSCHYFPYFLFFF